MLHDERITCEIVDVIRVDLPRPRTERSPGFLDYVDKIYEGLSVKVAKA